MFDDIEYGFTEIPEDSFGFISIPIFIKGKEILIHGLVEPNTTKKVNEIMSLFARGMMFYKFDIPVEHISFDEAEAACRKMFEEKRAVGDKSLKKEILNIIAGVKR